jgi:hypothetical protein
MRRGFFFTLDVSIALLLVMVVCVLAYAYAGRLQSEDFENAVRYSYAQDAANVLLASGCLQDAYCQGRSDLACANNVLAASSPSVCIDLVAYNASNISFNGAIQNSGGELLFTLSKPGCDYSGGAIQSVTFSFTCGSDQSATNEQKAVLRVWQRGVK